MKDKIKNKLIASQVIMIAVFITGMMLNFYIILPVVDEGEGFRMASDLDSFCSGFFPETGCDLNNVAQMDSLAAHDPYEEGYFLVMTPDAEIIYSNNGDKGYAYDHLREKYGKKAVNLLRLEQFYPASASRMDYDKRKHISLYASYVPERSLMFFYAVDYHIAGTNVYNRYMYLLAYLVVSGLLMIFISYLIVRGVSAKVRKESLVEQELDTASRIQNSMLPRGMKDLLQLDLDARLLPAKKVAGDFFCYFLNDGLLYFCIGDVSGKGIPASLFMSKAVTLFRSCANSGLTVRDMAAHINNELCINNDQNMFLTGIVGTINILDGNVIYVNAGHELPVIWDGKEESHLEYLDSKGCIPFGVIPDSDFDEEQYEMKKNGLMLFYTDGVSEARNVNKKLLGRKALLDIIEPYKNLSSNKINTRLLEYVSRFESGTSQSDDITVLTFRNTSQTKSLKITNDVNELKKLVPFTEEIFNECGIDRKSRILLRSGLDEALTNCVHYAYDTSRNEISLEASFENRCLIFTIQDAGREFNPLEYNPEVSDELQVGGLGISMYKSIFDDVQYKRANGYNILKLIKKL